MKKLFLFIILASLTFCAKAHTHKISSLFLIKEGDVWNAQVTASFSAYQYEMLNEMSEEKIKELTAEEVQSWISEHFKKNLIFQVNNEVINFGGSFVQLGHEIKVKLLLENMPNDVEELLVKNTSFLNSNSFHKSLFKVVIDKKPSKRFYLTTENKYTLLLDVNDDKVTLSVNIIKTLKENLFPILIFLGSILLVIFFLKKKEIFPPVGIV